MDVIQARGECGRHPCMRLRVVPGISMRGKVSNRVLDVMLGCLLLCCPAEMRKA